MSEPQIIVVPAADAGPRAAEIIAETLRDADAARGRADWATTGGSAAIPIYRALVEGVGEPIPWQDVHTWWGDDRFVPRDHPLSNVKAFDDVLLDIGGHQAGTPTSIRSGIHVPIENLHPFRTSEAIGEARGAAACAADLDRELRAAGLTEADGFPVLDLVLLGIGGDGHLLSVFPGSAAFDSSDWALAIPAPTHIEPHVERVTLNPAVVRVARRVLVVSLGASKAEILGQIFGPERDERRWPAQLARRPGATWILDEAAAAELPGR